MQGFVHLRCRSAYSLLEGALKTSDIARLAKAEGMPAVALTDADNLFGALEFSETLSQSGVQPIIGLSLAVRLAPPELGAKRAAPDGRLALLAQSEAGYRRLMALSSMAFLDVGAADEPHVPLSAACEEAEGLICLTGGPDGPLNRLIVQRREGEARKLLDRLSNAFPGRLYVELQRHGGAEEQTAEAFLVEEAYARGLPLVAANEPYFESPRMYEAHDALLCMGEGTFLGTEDRRRLTPDHHFASAAEMAARFSDLPEAIENTLDVARRCAFRVRTRKPILPNFTGEKGRDEAAELAAQAEAGLKARLAAGPMSAPEEDYWSRLRHELDVITSMGFPGYFLIVADFIKWAKAEGVPVGPGRGSGAGSVVAWALTITNLDPLRYGLLFERFLNPERVSMPDFDIDFCQERRGEVIDYVTQRYGADRVAQIITFGSLQARAVLRDVGRVMQLPLGMVDRLAKLVPFNPAHPVTLRQAIEGEPRLQSARDNDADVAKLLETALNLEGLYRNASTHAAGVVIGDRPLVELVPLYRDPRSPLPATQFNMNWVERAGLVKFDFLGLKTLTVIARALAYLEGEGVSLDLDAVPMDDRATFEMLSSGASIGVFQLESSGMRDTLKKLRPDKIEDVIALISLYRPGPMDNIDTYVDRKFGREQPDYLHPSLEPVLKETYGVIIYQEQVMQIAQILSGYSLGEADLLRRAMGKKKPEEMAKQRERFLSGAAERGVAADKAAGIFDLVAQFAGYGFNKSHAAAYALIAYQTAYLKANHPVAFMAALMSLDAHNTDKLAAFVQETKRMGITMLPPDVNASEADFSLEAGAVRYALGAVRNVGSAAMEALAASRRDGGAFASLFDLARRVDPRLVNKRAFESLAKAGAFDGVGADRHAAFAAAEMLTSAANASAAERDMQQSNLFDAAATAEPPLPAVQPWTAHERLDHERAAVGFYLSGHPLDDAADALRRRNVVFSAELAAVAAEGRERANICGVVRRRQEKVSQKSGERFAFVSLSDPTGEFEALAPPELLVRARDDLEAGAAVVCGARLSGRDGEVKIFLDSVSPLDTALTGAYGGLRIYVDGPDAIPGVHAWLTRLADREGGDCGQVALVAPAGPGREAEVALPGALPVDAAARAALKTAPGVVAVEEM